MILLDTNVLSALMHRDPDAEVIAWLDRQPHHSVWTTAISVFEIRCGLQLMAAGKRRTFLVSAFEVLLDQLLEQRIVNFDSSAAQRAADLMASRQRQGRLVELRDTMIAGITVASHAKLATRNVKHFEDIAASVINPWQP